MTLAPIGVRAYACAMSLQTATRRRDFLDPLGTHENERPVLLHLQERIQPACRSTAVADHAPEFFGKATRALHATRTGGLAGAAARHRRRSCRTALVHDLRHQAYRTGMGWHQRSSRTLDRGKPRNARPLLRLLLSDGCHGP